jgi:hypothetical protein
MSCTYTRQHKCRKMWTYIHATSGIQSHDPSVLVVEDINPSTVFAVHGYAAFKWSYLWFAVRVYARLQAQFRNAINMVKITLEIHRLHYCVAKGVRSVFI